MGSLVEDLLAPGVELVETHISWVFLHPQVVYKVKKPVALGFLDFSTRKARRAASEAEVELNRRLAPAVYRGLVPVTRDASGRHRLGGHGEAVDWAVEMVRLPDADRADVLLADGRLGAKDLERVAGLLAAFHAGARCDEETSRFGTPEAIGGNVRENFAQTRGLVAAHLDPAQAAEIEAWQLRFLAEHRDRFLARVAAGRVRDGHGDLRLEHLYLASPPGAGAAVGAAAGAGVTVLDCIEFAPRFRFADVAADVAFLSMDLAARGRVDLAERFLAAYAREADDFDLYPLIDFYEGYRAYVRAKIASLVAADPAVDLPHRERAAEEARRHFLLALAFERRSLLPPAVVAVGGILAAGKTTVAGQLGAAMSAPVVDADRTRKHLLGVEPGEPLHHRPWQGAYTEETTERVYAELLRRAGAVLDSGRAVVLDASFRARRHREAARRLAAERGVPFTFVECRTHPDLCRERLVRRAALRGVSDGRLEIFDEFLAAWEPVAELAEAEHAVLDTARPLEANLEALRGRLPTWPPGLTA